MGEGFAQGLGIGTGETGEHLPLNPAGQVRARPTRCQEELRNAGVALLGHSKSQNLLPGATMAREFGFCARLETTKFFPART